MVFQMALGSSPRPKHDGQISPSVDFIAGGLVSAISKAAVYPMETKVLLMQLGETAKDPLLMWHGVTLKALENFLYNGLLWLLKERVRPPPPDPAQPEKRPPATFTAAFWVSCLAVLLAHPLSNTVVGMQASLKQTPLSAVQVAKSILEHDGIAGFFKGWQLSVALRVGSAMTIVVYEYVRARLAGVVGKDASNFAAGLLGRLSEVYVTHPMKTLRSRLQQGQPLLPSLGPSALVGLWAGVGTMAFADAVKIGIRFGCIERVRMLLQHVLNVRRKKQKIDDEEVHEDRVVGG